MINIFTMAGNLQFETREDSPSDEAILREIFLENVYRLHDNMLSDGGIILDVGANIGAFTLDIIMRARNNGNPVTVIAVEPEPNNLELLKKNIEINKHLFGGSEVIICEKAIGDHRGGVFISDGHGGSRISDDGAEVEMITLNDLVKEYKLAKVDFAKFDIEGSEVPTLLLASNKTLDMFEHTAIEFDEQNGLEKFAKLVNRFAR